MYTTGSTSEMSLGVQWKLQPAGLMMDINRIKQHEVMGRTNCLLYEKRERGGMFTTY
jgi:hypothetical protein